MAKQLKLPPAMAKNIKMVSAEILKPYERNARTHSRDQVNKIMESMREFGFTAPILVDAKFGVIAGHGRLMAAKKMGLDEVPVIILDHLTDAQKRAYILADNRLALDAGWDEELLSKELATLDNDGFDLSMTGFSSDEIDQLLKDIDGADFDDDSRTEEDEVPVLKPKPVSRPGDVWVLGEHRVICGDSTSVDSVSELMDGQFADCLWTDPPYNVNYEGAASGRDKKKRDKIQNDHMDNESFYKFLRDVFGTAFSFMRAGAPAYVAHADSERINFASSFQESGFYLSSCLIWKKNALVLGRLDYQMQHEPILYGWKPGTHSWYGGRKNTTIIEVDGLPYQQIGENEYQINVGNRSLVIRGENLTVDEEYGTVIDHPKPSNSKQHPTMKPVGLIEIMLKNSTKRNDIVLDLFGDSGSTLIACEKMKRRARLVELDEKYVDVIVKRWQDYTGKQAVQEATGKTYNELAG